MDLLDGIRTRRSIRKYTDEPVTEREINILLQCAMLAPSAKNARPWHFVVATEAEEKQKLAQASPYAHMAASAPLVIVVCVDMREEKVGDFWIQDCSAATENILLAARGLNLGSVWCGIYNEPERVRAVQGALEMPAEVIPFNIICIGHTTQPFTEANRYMPERIHREKWREDNRA